jgi:hypothetical protein
MRIGHERDVHIRMPQRLRDRDDIHPLGEQVAREGVAEIVESYLTRHGRRRAALLILSTSCPLTI